MNASSTSRLLIFLLLGTSLLLLSGFRPVNTDEDNIALAGYDPVAYHLEKRPVEGSVIFAMRWEGAIWRFSKSSHLRMFRRDPERWAPQYGGYCSLCISQGNLTDFDPEQFEIYEDRLYLFQDKETRMTWRENPEKYMDKSAQEFEAIAAERSEENTQASS